MYQLMMLLNNLPGILNGPATDVVYNDFSIVNPVSFVDPNVKVIGNVAEVSTDDVINAVVLKFD